MTRRIMQNWRLTDVPAVHFIVIDGDSREKGSNRLSGMQASAARAGSRMLHASAAIGAFGAAVSEEKGESGGRLIGRVSAEHAPSTSSLQRFEHLGGVGVHLEFRDAAVVHGPDVCEWRGHRAPGALVAAGVDPERDDAVALGDVIVRFG